MKEGIRKEQTWKLAVVLGVKKKPSPGVWTDDVSNLNESMIP